MARTLTIALRISNNSHHCIFITNVQHVIIQYIPNSIVMIRQLLKQQNQQLTYSETLLSRQSTKQYIIIYTLIYQRERDTSNNERYHYTDLLKFNLHPYIHGYTRPLLFEYLISKIIFSIFNTFNLNRISILAIQIQQRASQKRLMTCTIYSYETKEVPIGLFSIMINFNKRELKNTSYNIFYVHLPNSIK